MDAFHGTLYKGGEFVDLTTVSLELNKKIFFLCVTIRFNVTYVDKANYPFMTHVK